MAEKRDYSEITPEIQALAAHCSEDCVIDKELYTKYKVNRGLRDLNGNGVLTGLTEISEIQAKTPDGESCDGSLFYRGYNVRDLVKGFLKDEDGKWMELNATHQEMRICPIPEGQEVVIVIGEELNEERIQQYFAMQ